jgi:acetyl esterase/lipase
VAVSFLPVSNGVGRGRDESTRRARAPGAALVRQAQDRSRDHSGGTAPTGRIPQASSAAAAKAQATHVDLDGVKAVAVVTLACLGGRLVLYLHGGGHVSGSPALYGDFTWRIAAATRARTVILDHRLAPEHPFPAALNDAVTAYRALVADGVNPRRMAVLGESSGGTKFE